MQPSFLFIRVKLGYTWLNFQFLSENMNTFSADWTAPSYYTSFIWLIHTRICLEKFYRTYLALPRLRLLLKKWTKKKNSVQLRATDTPPTT